MAGRVSGGDLNYETVNNDELYSYLIELRRGLDKLQNNQLPARSISTLSSGATTADIIAKLNEVITSLKAAGIVS